MSSSYLGLVRACIAADSSVKGSTLPKIKQFVGANNGNFVNRTLLLQLRNAVAKGTLIQVKGRYKVAAEKNTPVAKKTAASELAALKKTAASELAALQSAHKAELKTVKAQQLSDLNALEARIDAERAQPKSYLAIVKAGIAAGGGRKGSSLHAIKKHLAEKKKGSGYSNSVLLRQLKEAVANRTLVQEVDAPGHYKLPASGPARPKPWRMCRNKGKGHDLDEDEGRAEHVVEGCEGRFRPPKGPHFGSISRNHYCHSCWYRHGTHWSCGKCHSCRSAFNVELDYNPLS